MDWIAGRITEVFDVDAFELQIEEVKDSDQHTYGPVERARLLEVSAEEMEKWGGKALLDMLRRELKGRRVELDVRWRDKRGWLMARILKVE